MRGLSRAGGVEGVCDDSGRLVFLYYAGIFVEAVTFLSLPAPA